MTIEAITANRLRDGAVVWLDKAGGWTELVTEAALFDDETAAEALADAGEAERQNIVVGIYLIEIAITKGVPVPTSYRELIRALGPSVRTDLGKQAEQGANVAPVVAAAGEYQ